MTKSRQNNDSVHEQAVSILERHILENLGATLHATGRCNVCGGRTENQFGRRR